VSSIRRFRLLAVLIVVAVFALSGAARAAAPHVLRFNFDAEDITSLNPFLGTSAPYNALPVGIGPFRYTAYHRGDRVEMEANPQYWRGKPKLDGDPLDLDIAPEH
jgi:ABC-type transport system substrate-binding protein